MIRSMTGYSKVRCEEKDFSIGVGLKSVNHRYLDLQFRLPSELAPLEPLLRRTVKKHLHRGHVEVVISLERPAASELELDRNLLDAYVRACRELRTELNCTGDPDPVALLRIPGVIASNGEISEKDLSRIQKALEKVMAESLVKLNEMRASEGALLEQDIRSRLARLEELRKGVAKLAKRFPKYTQQRLENRLGELLGAVHIDQARLAQEVAYLSSRSDIAEELTRFESHLIQARQLLSEGSEVGKKLDFLLQELNREANTLLSKISDVPEIGAEAGRQGIEMKSEIEKLREQVQNIE